MSNIIKKKMRKDMLPTRSDILYIIKHFDKLSFEQIRRNLNVSNAKLIQWCKFIFTTDKKEAKWNEMNKKLDALEFHEEFTDSMQSEYDVHDIRTINGKNMYIVKKKIVNENRMCYLITINNENSMIVRFDIPVERTSVAYCPVSLGCDYDVHSLGHWEYQQLEQDLPVIHLEADEEYIGKFWLAVSNTMMHEA